MFEIVEQGASRLGKGFVAGMADVLAFGTRMDANTSACATVGLGANYQLRRVRSLRRALLPWLVCSRLSLMGACGDAAVETQPPNRGSQSGAPRSQLRAPRMAPEG